MAGGRHIGVATRACVKRVCACIALAAQMSTAVWVGDLDIVC